MEYEVLCVTQCVDTNKVHIVVFALMLNGSVLKEANLVGLVVGMRLGITRSPLVWGFPLYEGDYLSILLHKSNKRRKEE